MGVPDQPLLDEVRRLAELVDPMSSGRELLFVNRLTLAYLQAEAGERGEFLAGLRAAEEVAPVWLRSGVRALAAGVRAAPAVAFVATLSPGGSRARGRSASRRLGSGARRAPTPAQPLLALTPPLAAG